METLHKEPVWLVSYFHKDSPDHVIVSFVPIKISENPDDILGYLRDFDIVLNHVKKWEWDDVRVKKICRGENIIFTVQTGEEGFPQEEDNVA